MAEWWPVLLFLGFLFGGSMFVLITGYVSTEAERARAKLTGETPPSARERPSFFVPPEPKPEAPAASIDGGVPADLARRAKRPVREKDLRRYLAAERAAVAAFMAEPSVDALYRN